jgi:hypothetical protein
MPLPPPRSSRSRRALVALLAALVSAVAAGCGSGGPDGSGPAASPDSGRCAKPGINDVSTPGTRAQTVLATPPGTRLESLGLDLKYVAWTQVSRDGTGVVCQRKFATGSVTALARAPVKARGVVTTATGVYFTAAQGSGAALYSVDHAGRRVRDVARSVTAPISGFDRYVAYADAPADGVNRVTVLDTSRSDAVFKRYRFPTCRQGGCGPVVSVSMLANGVAWMQRLDDGTGSLLTVRPFTGKRVTSAVDVAKSVLYRSDNFPVYDYTRGTSTYAAWLISTGVIQPIGNFEGNRLLALGGGQFFVLAGNEGEDQTIRAYSATTGKSVEVDDLGVLKAGANSLPLLQDIATAGRRFCTLVNTFPTATPAENDVPEQSSLRCGHIPAG